MKDPVALVAPTIGVQAEFSRPAAAGGPAQFLTVWEHDRAGGAYQDIHARIAIPPVLYIPVLER